MSRNSSVYNELRLEQQLCDAVIRVDNVEFQVHKIILCNHSQYFRALFSHWSAPDCRVFDIPNVAPGTMKFIIEFAYTGFVPVTKDNVQELFIAANRFGITGIMQACNDLLEKQLAPQNCIGIWWFTDLHYNPQLKEKALLFTLNHFEEVAAISDEFLQLSANELVKIIESDQLSVKQEKTVYEAILRWVTFAPEQRKEHTSLLLSKVRLALINPSNILEMMNGNEFVKMSEECQIIVLNALQTMIDIRLNKSKHMFYNPLTRPRLPSSILFAVGGWSQGDPINCIETYDVRADRWVTIPNYNEAPRAYQGAVFLDGSVYCMGGCDSNEQLNTVQRFNLTTRTWQEVAPMHSHRCYVSVTLMDGYIYAIGGFDGHVRFNSAERYQPRTNQWTLIASMHEQRSDASCTTLYDKIYICGGFNGNECLSSAESYNPKANQWTLIRSMGSRRSGLGVITYAARVFAVGGFSGTVRLHTVEAYNPDTNTWEDMPSMLSPRSNFGISVIDDSLFAVGGYSGFTTIPNVECYDVNTGDWSDVCNMEISRSALSCCVVYGLNNMAEYAAPRYLLEPKSEEEDKMAA